MRPVDHPRPGILSFAIPTAKQCRRCLCNVPLPGCLLAQCRAHFQQTMYANIDLKINSSGAGQTYGRAFYHANSHDIARTVDDIAASLTKAIRKGPNTTTVDGEALLPVVVIQVRWAWLVYSAALLVVVVMQSLRAPDRVWKSSSLALLIHALIFEPTSDGVSPNSRREMEEMAAGLKAELREIDDGRLLLSG